jgi:hypothetical protein
MVSVGEGIVAFVSTSIIARSRWLSVGACAGLLPEACSGQVRGNHKAWDDRPQPFELASDSRQ